MGCFQILLDSDIILGSRVDIYLSTDIVPKVNNLNNVSSIENSTMYVEYHRGNIAFPRYPAQVGTSELMGSQSEKSILTHNPRARDPELGIGRDLS